MASLSLQVRNGLLWTSGGRIIDRLLAFIKIPILSYLLDPRDFGLMGIVSAVMLYLDVLTRTGFDRALIQKDDFGQYLDTTWSLNALKGVFQTGLLFILVLPIAAFYSEPLLKSLLLVTALILLIQNFRSINLIQLERNLAMKHLTIYESGATIFSSLVTVVSAYFLRNVWALVIGQIALSSYALVVSYIYAPYRPRFELNKSKIRELWNYGKWIMLGSWVVATLDQVDSLYVGKVLGIATLGYYNMAYNLGKMIPIELSDRLRRVFFPAYAMLKNDTPRLRAAFVKSHIFNVFLGGLLSLGLFFLADAFVSVFLANKWAPMVPVLRIFSVWCFFQMMLTTFAPLYMAVGRPNLWSNIQLVRLVALVALIYPLTAHYGMNGTAYAVTISTAAMLPACFFFSKKILSCSWSQLMGPVLLCMLAGLFVSCMAVVWQQNVLLSSLMNLLLLGTSIVVAYFLAALAVDTRIKVGIWPLIKQVIRPSQT